MCVCVCVCIYIYIYIYICLAPWSQSLRDLKEGRGMGFAENKAIVTL